MKLAFVVGAAVFFCACAAAPVNTGFTLKKAVPSVVATYQLGQEATQQDFEVFRRYLLDCYNQTLQLVNAKAGSFTYSVTPLGAVSPFSRVEVKCITVENATTQQARACADFFTAVEQKYK